jgi:methylated-DNA-[protein]-cysteine S-methyltransferase
MPAPIQNPPTPTAFQVRVYDALKKIPRGRVTTYGLLARHLQCGSPRAVGQALRANPFAPEVPCHRVISSTLRLGGYQGRTSGVSVERKISLLQQEGVQFINNQLAEPEVRLFHF